MRLIFISIFLAIYLFTGAFSLLAKDKEYSYYPLSLDDGLSQTTIRAILMDRQGTLWLGTRKGVNAFKQHELTSFTSNPEDTLSLPDDLINTLAEDSSGKIWAGTVKGLSVYDKQEDKFLCRLNQGIFSSYSTQQEVYFGGNNTLIKYVQGKDQPIILSVNADFPEGDTRFRIVDIEKLTDDRLLLATKERGVYVFNTRSQEFHHLIDDELHLAQAICAASDHKIYVSTQGSGVFQYTQNGKLEKKYNIDMPKMGTNFILDLTEFNNELWISTDGEGIKILDLKTRELRSLEHVPGNPFTLPTNAVTTLFRTHNNQLWAGSVRRGAFCIKESFIRTYGETSFNNPNGLTEAAIISLYEDEDGMLWIGTDGGGVNLFNPKTKTFKHFPSTYGDKIVSIAQLNKDELLLSIYTKGMFIFNKRSGSYKRFIIVDEETNFNECLMGYLPMAHRVAKDKIYIIGEHPWIYTPSKKDFQKMRTTDNACIKMEDLVLAHSNSEFSLLMCKNQVFKVDQRSDQASLLFELEPNITVVSLAYDENHTIWVGSSIGLGYYDLNTKQYTKVPTKLFDTITFLIYDGKDRLWLGAQSNLFSYLIKENKFTQVNRSDGFLPNEILFAYQNMSKKEFIYLGGSNGLVQIDNNIPKEQSATPEIRLDNVYLDGKLINNQLNQEDFEISHNYNSLVVNLQIQNEDIFQKNYIRFSIIKDGVSQDFETYNTRMLIPASLSAGTYELAASCFTKNGDLTPPVKLMRLKILPPWYRSVWFFVSFYLCCFGIISAFALISYYRKAKNIRRNMHKYKQRVNEEKINFLINVNHELRTPLTLIYSPLKRIIEKGENNSHTSYTFGQLQQIYKQVGRMYNIINMVLDLNRVESGNADMKMDRHNLNKWVKDTSDDFLCEAHDKRIVISYEFDPEITDLWFDEWKCQIILSNLLMNAIKFSNPDTNIKVHTHLLDGNAVRIAVSDEGSGVADNDIARVFDRHYEGAHTCKGSGIGLAYSKMMAELHGGRMGVYNNEEKGATFYFELPLVQETEVVEQGMPPLEEQALPFMDTKGLDTNLKNYSILVVEDTEDLRNYLHDSFKECFKQVYTATNGQEALNICYDKDPDIIVSDVMMPVMDGFELCSRIKTDQRISHIMVVLLTARCKENDEKLGYKLGADFYVKKPFDMDFLQTVLANILNKRKVTLKEQFENEVPSPQEVTYSQADEEFLRKLNGIITANLSNEELNISLITSQMGMSRASLYNKMSKITGLGVNDYVNRIKIDKAVELLLHSSLSVKEISQELGFSYPRYFSTTFKQVKGMTPTQFKENHQENK